MRIKKGYYIEDFFGKSFSILPPLHVHKTQKHTHTHTQTHIPHPKEGGRAVSCPQLNCRTRDFSRLFGELDMSFSQ